MFLLRWSCNRWSSTGRGDRRRSAQRGALVRCPDVRAGAQQPRRVRDVRRLHDDSRGRCRGSVDDITWLEKTVLGAGTTLGVIAMTVALWPSLRSTGFRWRLTGGWSRPPIRRIVRLAGVGARVRGCRPGRLPAITCWPGGSVSRGSRSTPRRSSSSCCRTRSSRSRSSPRCCRRWRSRWFDGGRGGVLERFSLGVRDTIVVIVPAPLGVVVLAEPIVSLLLEYGAVGSMTSPWSRAFLGVQPRAPVLLRLPADHPDVLRDPGQPNPPIVNIGAADRDRRGRRSPSAHDRMGCARTSHSATSFVRVAAALGHALAATALGSLDGARVGRRPSLRPAGRGGHRGGCRTRRPPSPDRRRGTWPSVASCRSDSRSWWVCRLCRLGAL